VLATKVSKQGLGNPITDERLISTIVPKITRDSALSDADLLTLVLTYHSISIYSAPQLTLPVSVAQFGTFVYEGRHIGDIEFPAEPNDQKTIDSVLGTTMDTNSLNGKPLPQPSAVTVSVLNGANTEGQPTEAVAGLVHLGFDVIGSGRTTQVSNEVETTVTFAKKTPADEGAAELVARSMSGAVTTAYGPTADGAQVTVTTGTDFIVNASAPQPKPKSTPKKTTKPKKSKGTPTSNSSSTTTSSTVPSGTLGAPKPPSVLTTKLFYSPSPQSQKLEPWDPRSCTPTGGPGP
jgi:hypothetical protein